ncbi:MAG: hypothetical protein V3V31_12695 [Methylococcales bacterium]
MSIQGRYLVVPTPLVEQRSGLMSETLTTSNRAGYAEIKTSILRIDGIWISMAGTKTFHAYASQLCPLCIFYSLTICCVIFVKRLPVIVVVT